MLSSYTGFCSWFWTGTHWLSHSSSKQVVAGLQFRVWCLDSVCWVLDVCLLLYLVPGWVVAAVCWFEHLLFLFYHFWRGIKWRPAHIHVGLLREPTTRSACREALGWQHAVNFLKKLKFDAAYHTCGSRDLCVINTPNCYIMECSIQKRFRGLNIFGVSSTTIYTIIILLLCVSYSCAVFAGCWIEWCICVPFISMLLLLYSTRRYIKTSISLGLQVARLCGGCQTSSVQFIMHVCSTCVFPFPTIQFVVVMVVLSWAIVHVLFYVSVNAWW